MSDLDEQLRPLAARAATGDMDAAESLFRAMHEPLVGFLTLLGIRSAELDEVAQETAIELFRSLTRYEPDQPFLPWMRGFARNAAARHRRRFARDRSRAEALREFVTQHAEGDPEREPWWVDAERLRSCVARLPDRSQEVIRMHYFDGSRCERIAEQLRMTAVAVRKALSRSREVLRRCVETPQDSQTP